MSFHRSLFAILLSVIAGSPLDAQVVAQAPQQVARGAYPDIAADAGGGLHLVYVRDDSLYYRSRLNGNWSAE